MESYTDEIKEYVANYDKAIKNIKTIQDKLDNLSNAFNSASGNDIDRIRSDIKSVSDNLSELSLAIENAEKATSSRAASCDRCYMYYKNKEYPAYETDERSYSYGASVWIGSDGLIHIAQEYSEKLDFLETIASIFVSHAGELFDEYVISKEEMFKS